jgi:hypothetical protein
MNNKNIKKTISSLPSDYYANSREILYFSTYDECDDFFLPEYLIEKIWSWISSNYYNLDFLGDRDVGGSVSILSVNSGAGRILALAPKNSTIVAYNLDYTCKRITDFVCQDKADVGSYYSDMIDISQFFAIKNTNSSRKYDIVFTQPSSNYEFYKGIEYDKDIEKLSPIEYYTQRAMHFVNENGLLIIVCSKSDVKKIIESSYFQIKETIEIEGVSDSKYVGVIIQKTF